MSKIIAGPLNFSLIPSEEYPESGNYIIGVDTADGFVKKMDYLGAITLLAPVSTPPRANIIVVDATYGDDLNGEADDLSKPFATYAVALAKAQPGDTIVVMPGSYVIQNLVFKNGSVYAYPGVTFTGSKMINDAVLSVGESFKLHGYANITSNDTAIILDGNGDVTIEGERFTTTGSAFLNFQKVSGRTYIKARYFAGLVSSTMYLTGPATNSELVMDIDHFDNITSSGFEMNIYVSGGFAGNVTINAKKITTSPNRNATGSFMAYQNNGAANITINCDEFIDTTVSSAILYQNTGNVTFNAKKVSKASTLYFSNGGTGLTKIHCGEALLSGQIINNNSGGTSVLLSGSYTSTMNGSYIVYQKGGTTKLKNFDLNITGNSKGYYRDGAGTIIVDDAIICVSNTSINGYESDSPHTIIVNGRATTNGTIANLTNAVTGTIFVSDPDIKISM